jgi:hypothetical protein
MAKQNRRARAGRLEWPQQFGCEARTFAQRLEYAVANGELPLA